MEIHQKRRLLNIIILILGKPKYYLLKFQPVINIILYAQFWRKVLLPLASLARSNRTSKEHSDSNGARCSTTTQNSVVVR